MGAGSSTEGSEKPTLLNEHTTLQSDTYTLIFNVGAGAGIIMIILLICLILARVLFPKLFTGLCDRNRGRERMEELYGRLKNRYRREERSRTPPPSYQPPTLVHPMQSMMAQAHPFSPFQMPVTQPMPVRHQFLPMQDRIVELPAEPAFSPQQPLPPIPPPRTREQGNL